MLCLGSQEHSFEQDTDETRYNIILPVRINSNFDHSATMSLSQHVSQQLPLVDILLRLSALDRLN